MPVLIRDYETRSVAKLKKFGAWQYSKHPSTEVLCCAFAIDDWPVQLWRSGDHIPPEFIEAANNLDWLAGAFNSSFERSIEANENVRRVIVAEEVDISTVPDADSGNPSKRRHGLTISFRCECCGWAHDLAIALAAPSIPLLPIIPVPAVASLKISPPSRYPLNRPL
jgi:hypothetical protein